jgi:hypothetical protein
MLPVLPDAQALAIMKAVLEEGGSGMAGFSDPEPFCRNSLDWSLSVNH